MSQNYWNKTHESTYSNSDWSTKPTLFAEFAIKYFRSAGNVLDIGTGQGQDAIYFNSKGYHVTATDFSEQAISNAQQKSNHIKFIHLDTAEGLPFLENSFDIVYSHLALHYFDDSTTKKIFADIHRILKPTGIFATITNTTDDPEITQFTDQDIEPNFYNTPSGIKKRFFTTDYMKEITSDLFEPIIIDNQGETYKDEIKTLIRFIGKKI